MEERNSMRLHLTVGLWLTAALLLMGCTAGKTGSPATVNGPDVYERPENAYYYYMESQLAKGRGASEQSVAYLEKAAALQPDSVFLKKELALEYLQQKNTAGALELIDAILAQDPDPRRFSEPRIQPQGQRQEQREPQASHLTVAGSHTRRVDLNQDFVVLGHRFLYLARLENVRRPVGRPQHGFHPDPSKVMTT